MLTSVEREDLRSRRMAYLLGVGEEPMWHGEEASRLGPGWGCGGFNTEVAEGRTQEHREEKEKGEQLIELLA